MKDIIISAQRLKIEMWCLIGSFIAANLFNAGAIWYYGASYREMFTSLFYILVFTIFIYMLTVVLRLVFTGLRSLFLRAASRKHISH